MHQALSIGILPHKSMGTGLRPQDSDDRTDIIYGEVNKH